MPSRLTPSLASKRSTRFEPCSARSTGRPRLTGRRFHALYDKGYRRDVLQRAWELVRRNGGAAGVDQITLKQVEEHGVARLLDELAVDLRDGKYRPMPSRRAYISKPGSMERRPLSIPAATGSCRRR